MGRGGGREDEGRAEAEDDPCPAQTEAQHDDEEVQKRRIVYGPPSARFAFSLCRSSAIRSLACRVVCSLFGCVFDRSFDRFARMCGC